MHSVYDVRQTINAVQAEAKKAKVELADLQENEFPLALARFELGEIGRGEIKDYTRFRLSDRRQAWGKPEFVHKEFERCKYKGMDVHSRLKAKNSGKPNQRKCGACNFKNGSSCDYAKESVRKAE